MKKLYVVFITLFMHSLCIEASFSDVFNRNNAKTGIVSLLGASATFVGLQEINNLYYEHLWTNSTNLWQNLAISGSIGLASGILYRYFSKDHSSNPLDSKFPKNSPSKNNNQDQSLEKIFSTKNHLSQSAQEDQSRLAYISLKNIGNPDIISCFSEDFTQYCNTWPRTLIDTKDASDDHSDKSVSSLITNSSKNYQDILAFCASMIYSTIYSTQEQKDNNKKIFEDAVDQKQITLEQLCDYYNVMQCIDFEYEKFNVCRFLEKLIKDYYSPENIDELFNAARQSDNNRIVEFFAKIVYDDLLLDIITNQDIFFFSPETCTSIILNAKKIDSFCNSYNLNTLTNAREIINRVFFKTGKRFAVHEEKFLESILECLQKYENKIELSIKIVMMFNIESLSKSNNIKDELKTEKIVNVGTIPDDINNIINSFLEQWH